jgi:hypothetical protein
MPLNGALLCWVNGSERIYDKTRKFPRINLVNPKKLPQPKDCVRNKREYFLCEVQAMPALHTKNILFYLILDPYLDPFTGSLRLQILN